MGNVLWYKVVKTSSNGPGLVHWMEVRNGKVYISGNCETVFGGGGANDWIYFLDTLVTRTQMLSIPEDQRIPPFKTGRWTYFATFDLDGNNIDNHFVEARSRGIGSNGRAWEYLCGGGFGIDPFHIDNNGNIYIFTHLQYAGQESDPYTIIVDENVNKTYNFYLPGTGNNLHTAMMYKFSPDWELVYGRPMVDHTDGIATSWEWLGDSVNSHYTLYIMGISSDEADNMYVSGYLTLDLFGDFGGNLHKYPVHIYWSNTQYATIQDITSANPMGFVMKYDTCGLVQWCNQVYTRGENRDAAMASFSGVCVYNGSAYVLGQGGYNDNGLICFDNENNPLQRYQQSTRNQTFFVRYDAQTGCYLNQGVYPAENVLVGHHPAVLSNRVFAVIHTITSGIADKIGIWKNDGIFIQKININSSSMCKNPSVQCNAQGNLILSTTAMAPITFDNNVSADCPSGQSSAVFALYYDPSFAEPYVGIPQYGETVSNLKIWPNPANSVLNIESDNSSIDQIVITDLNGKMLLQETVGDNHKQIDISQLPAGIYLLKAVRNGEESIGKFAKTNN